MKKNTIFALKAVTVGALLLITLYIIIALPFSLIYGLYTLAAVSAAVFIVTFDFSDIRAFYKTDGIKRKHKSEKGVS